VTRGWVVCVSAYSVAYGTGTLGALTFSASGTIDTDAYLLGMDVTSFTVAAGVTLTVGGRVCQRPRMLGAIRTTFVP
jgi:hypothetical protein